MSDKLMQVELMKRAIETAEEGITTGDSPFGAVIADAGGTIVAAAHNTVRSEGDVTAHAEINAIRKSCCQIGTIDLSGYVIATTCEPCPMCAAAIHWARLDAVIFGANIADARAAGFNELDIPCRLFYSSGSRRVEVYSDVSAPECRLLFAQWQRGPNPIPY